MIEFKNAIGYIRTSETGEYLDLTSQKQEILLYANDHHYNIVEWCYTKDSQDSFDEMIHSIEISNPPYDAIIAFSNDYITKEPILYFYYLYALDRKNIKMLITQDHFPSNKDWVNMCTQLVQFISEKEGKLIADRTGRARRIKASTGSYAGGRAPMGYRVENGMLVINQKEAVAVKMIFDLRKQGCTMAKIIDQLDLEGLRGRSGRPFGISTVQSILNNEQTYRGYYCYGKNGEWVKGKHEPILKDE